jgi:Ulp1 family protease
MIILRYLQCEWDTKFPNSKRSFTKDTIFGSRIKVPSQNNYFDCGIYLLQYVENFFLVSISCLFFTPLYSVKFS